MLRRGTSEAALTRLGENVLCLRLLGHDRLGAIKFSLGPRIGPGNARIGPRTAAILAWLSVSRGALKALNWQILSVFGLQMGTPGPPAPREVLQESQGRASKKFRV